jgi:hypothetical protein
MATSRTVTQIIQAALRVLGVLAAGETVSTNDTGTGLTVLQDLVSEWSGEGLTIPYETAEAITLVGSQASYTVGQTGTPDLTTVRPINITDAFIRDSSNYDHPVKVVSFEEYNRITSKTTEERPSLLTYVPTAPNGTVYVWPTPSTAESLYIVSRKPLTDPAQLTDDVLTATGIPRNYHSALKWNLALELAPEYGVNPIGVIAAKAEQTYNKILSTNFAQAAAPVRTGLESGDRYSVLTN